MSNLCSVFVRLAGIGLLGAAVAGCVPKEARDHARFLSALTDKVRTDGEQFATFRDELDRARQLNTDILEANALEAEHSARHALDVWQLAATDDQTRLYTRVREAADRYEAMLKEVAGLRERQERERAAVASAVHVRSDDLARTSQLLVQLSEEPDFQSQVKFFVEYGKAVNEAVKKAQKEAEAQAKEGKKTAEDQRDALAAAANTDRALRKAAATVTTQPTTQPGQ